MISYRLAKATEVGELKSLLWEHGPNEWNYLTEEGVNDELQLVESGKAFATVALYEDEIVGFAILISGIDAPNYVEKYGRATEASFIGDVVVSKKHAKKGIASQLLRECVLKAQTLNSKLVLIERHEENLASAGMMKNAGFTIYETFCDPNKRTSGSQNSVILGYVLDN
ncbi:GNAT family N-acetyltransferase [Pseudoalteromonas luteoviolacea]|uniref:GNAT family N-acetyltransferase n=1 Tax=Pseudoalteromonas luteoviolacea TaxID=43657 RepID=A0A1C0TW95_9GAMM|nr:GNAT family N-acetyltransferase [Pseudoalteromonas luteoviolacea]OCQ23514.1 GNAT family N-acetyltransferase [Pseudoalteromonas luteoviolacea]